MRSPRTSVTGAWPPGGAAAGARRRPLRGREAAVSFRPMAQPGENKPSAGPPTPDLTRHRDRGTRAPSLLTRPSHHRPPRRAARRPEASPSSTCPVPPGHPRGRRNLDPLRLDRVRGRPAGGLRLRGHGGGPGRAAGPDDRRPVGAARVVRRDVPGRTVARVPARPVAGQPGPGHEPSVGRPRRALPPDRRCSGIVIGVVAQYAIDLAYSPFITNAKNSGPPPPGSPAPPTGGVSW